MTNCISKFWRQIKHENLWVIIICIYTHVSWIKAAEVGEPQREYIGKYEIRASNRTLKNSWILCHRWKREDYEKNLEVGQKYMLGYENWYKAMFNEVIHEVEWGHQLQKMQWIIIDEDRTLFDFTTKRNVKCNY